MCMLRWGRGKIRLDHVIQTQLVRSSPMPYNLLSLPSCAHLHNVKHKVVILHLHHIEFPHTKCQHHTWFEDYIPCTYYSRRSRIFLKRRPLSCEVPSRRDSVGGGSSRIFLWSPEADAIQWDGGVVAEFFFSVPSKKKRRDSVGGGGVVPGIFR